jgi:Right handed beta helix region
VAGLVLTGAAAPGFPGTPAEPTARVVRPVVTPGPASALVTWKRGTDRRFRVDLKTRTGPWRHIARTRKHRYRITGINALVVYRVAVCARRHGRWVRVGKPSKRFQPLPARTPVAPTPGPGAGSSPPTPTPGLVVGDPDPGMTPPADAVVVWVNPASGDDDAAGTQAAPLRTVAQAWERIPQGVPLSRPHWIQLEPGTYPEGNTPGYWEQRYGTADAPVVLNAARGAHTAALAGDINAYDVRHLTIAGVDIDRTGDAFHCEQCSYVQLRRMRLAGHGGAHETIKVNQSDHIVIADSDVSGAYENAIDYVAVQYSEISGNRIHAADDWCAYAKGGSAYVTVVGNEIFDCGTGGFTAGQGTGFEYMVAPWLQYEAYGVTLTDNVIHDTDGAGLGVNGGYDIVYAFNTLFRVGTRSHTVEFVHGGRGCDGDTARCRQHHDQGGWGGVAVAGQWIPSKHVAFVDNIVFNPPGVASRWAHLAVAGPAAAPDGSNVPNPSLADADLVMRGNVFRDGDASMDSGLADAAAFLAQNWVNSLTPDLVDPAGGDFRPLPGGTIAALPAVAVPAQSWSDSSGVPAMVDRVIPTDRPPGALRP